MRTILCAVVLLLARAPLNAGEWQTLFNGKDLAGWRANLSPEAFTVVDGAIRAHALKNTSAHLFYVGDQKDGLVRFKNFEMEADVRSEPNANSGIFLHCDMATRDAAMHLAKGYEVQLNSSPHEKRKTGSLYGIVDLDKSPVDETRWFTVRITVKDKQIVVHLDGRQVVDYTEPKDAKRPPERVGRLLDPQGGAIALQAHDPESVCYFKNIRIRRLP